MAAAQVAAVADGGWVALSGHWRRVVGRFSNSTIKMHQPKLSGGASSDKGRSDFAAAAARSLSRPSLYGAFSPRAASRDLLDQLVVLFLAALPVRTAHRKNRFRSGLQP